MFRFLTYRQSHGEGCAVGSAGRGYLPAVALYDLVGYRKPQPVSLAHIPCGEERVEYLVQMLRCDAGPGVVDLKHAPPAAVVAPHRQNTA